MKNLNHITCIADMRRVYRRRVPKMFVDYVDSGSYTEGTYHRNEADFQTMLLRQKVLVDMSGRSQQTTMLGETVSMPVALAPTGLAGMQHANGEMLAARAASQFGVPFILSTMSVCSLEDVAPCASRPLWFQLYMMRDREFMKQLIERAKKVGCSALILTADLQIMGQRHKDIKNGLSTPPKPTVKTVLNLLTKPTWCYQMSQTKRHQLGNIVGHVSGISDTGSLSVWTAEQFDPQLSWDDVAWVKAQWGGKLVIKRIMQVDDAKAAVAAGADALVVSNHGGRQLDGAPSTISVLPEIVAAVGQDTEVWLDSGIRSGQDILKALALGAKGVLIGRAYNYGLGAYGEDGVTRVLQILQKELDTTMALCGKTQIDQLDGSVLR